MQARSAFRGATAQQRLHDKAHTQLYAHNQSSAVVCRPRTNTLHHVDNTHNRFVACTAASSRRSALGVLAGSAIALSAAGADFVLPPPAEAALKDYNLDPNAPIDEVSVQLGTADGQYVFTPSTIRLTMGRITKLKLSNPSTSTHYFTPLEFAEKVFTIQVLAGDPAVEVKGAVAEVALKAGASATWVLVPMKPGRYPLRCTVKGHDAMLGQIVVERPE